MPTEQPDNPNAIALQKLTEILDYAVAAGVDHVELEFDSSGDLEIMYVSGNTGIGDVLNDHKLAWSLVNCITKKARLQRNLRSKFTIELQGEPYAVYVTQYDSFGEPAFKLRIRKPKH